MAKFIDLRTATNEQLENYLLDYWELDKFLFVGEYHYDDNLKMGYIDNVHSYNGHKIAMYPIIKNRPVHFKIPKKLTGSWCSFECALASDYERKKTHNPFALTPHALKPIKVPDFVNLSKNTEDINQKNSSNNYANELDLPIDDKDKSEVGIIRWRLNLRNLRL